MLIRFAPLHTTCCMLIDDRQKLCPEARQGLKCRHWCAATLGRVGICIYGAYHLGRHSRNQKQKLTAETRRHRGFTQRTADSCMIEASPRRNHSVRRRFDGGMPTSNPAAPRRCHHIACVAAPCICPPGARAKMPTYFCANPYRSLTVEALWFSVRARILPPKTLSPGS